jgi:hypothetical protein
MSFYSRVCHSQTGGISKCFLLVYQLELEKYATHESLIAKYVLSLFLFKRWMGYNHDTF